MKRSIIDDLKDLILNCEAFEGGLLNGISILQRRKRQIYAIQQFWRIL